jgi:hypothetical protein
VKPDYKAAPPSKAELEREKVLAVTRAAKENGPIDARRSTQPTKKKKEERKQRQGNPANQHFDPLIRQNAKAAIGVFELVMKKKRITRNGHLGGRKDLRARLALRLAEAGLLTLQTVDIDGNPADHRQAFRNSTLDRIYTPMPDRDKSVEKMLYGLK